MKIWTYLLTLTLFCIMAGPVLAQEKKTANPASGEVVKPAAIDRTVGENPQDESGSREMRRKMRGQRGRPGKGGGEQGDDRGESENDQEKSQQGTSPARLLKRFDANGDGLLNVSELSALLSALKSRGNGQEGEIGEARTRGTDESGSDESGSGESGSGESDSVNRGSEVTGSSVNPSDADKSDREERRARRSQQRRDGRRRPADK